MVGKRFAVVCVLLVRLHAQSNIQLSNLTVILRNNVLASPLDNGLKNSVALGFNAISLCRQ